MSGYVRIDHASRELAVVRRVSCEGVEDEVGHVQPARNFGWPVHASPPAILARQLRCFSTEAPPQISFRPPRRRHPPCASSSDVPSYRFRIANNYHPGLEAAKPYSRARIAQKDVCLGLGLGRWCHCFLRMASIFLSHGSRKTGLETARTR
jgi:hypothetical protein